MAGQGHEGRKWDCQPTGRWHLPGPQKVNRASRLVSGSKGPAEDSPSKGGQAPPCGQRYVGSEEQHRDEIGHGSVPTLCPQAGPRQLARANFQFFRNFVNQLGNTAITKIKGHKPIIKQITLKTKKYSKLTAF